jgi:hypothetical protein
MTATRKRKPKTYDRDLHRFIGDMREACDRFSVVMQVVDAAENLVLCVLSDNPNVKAIARIVQESIDRANEAMAGEDDE